MSDNPLNLEVPARQGGPEKGYLVRRVPADPTTPGSPQVGKHSFEVVARTDVQRLAGQVQVALEQAADQVVTVGVHEAPIGHRSLHLDAGRHYFSPSHIKQILHLMAWCRLNVLDLHISDTHGYRVASALHPEIVSKHHLSKDEIEQIVAYAAELGIEVVPSFDMPGHLHKVLGPNQWAGLRDDCGQLIPGALNILDPQAKELVWDLMDEVVQMFSATSFTVGADEFLEYGTRVDSLERQAVAQFGPGAHGNDVWIDFANQCVQRLAEQGIAVNLFNDGVHVDAKVIQISAPTFSIGPGGEHIWRLRNALPSWDTSCTTGTERVSISSCARKAIVRSPLSRVSGGISILTFFPTKPVQFGCARMVPTSRCGAISLKP